MKQLKVISSLIIIVAMLMVAVPAKAADVSVIQNFTGICNNNLGDVAIGEAQLAVDVTDNGDGRVRFTFTNSGPEASNIAEIYFDDGSLLDFSTPEIIDNPPSVDFHLGGEPPNLPCAQNVVPPFEAIGNFTSEPVTPESQKGVGPGEQVVLIFSLDAGKTFTDVLAELGDGTLRIGIHVTAFASGGSEAFITGTPTAITLASFGTKCSRGSVSVNWTTGTEIDNAGFNIYRSTSADGARIRLTGKILAARGDAVSGGSYSFSDASGYGTFYYWLEDVSYTGKATLHGPVLAVVTSPFRSPLYRPALPSR